MMTGKKTANGLTIALVAVGIVGFAAGSANAGTIYYDNFDGADVTLTGTAPDIRPGSEVWSGGGQYRANGNNTGNGNAYLPFTPVTGNVYTLSADITGSGLNWGAFGFASNNANAAFYDASVNGYGTFLHYKTDAIRNVRCDAGVGQNNSAWSNGIPAGTLALKVVLDATDADSANWTMEWFINGSQARAPTTVGVGDYGTIGYAGFNTIAGGLTGTVDNFVLEDDSGDISLDNQNVASNAAPGTLVGNLGWRGAGTVDEYEVDQTQGDYAYFDIPTGTTNLRTAAWMATNSLEVYIIASSNGTEVATNSFTITVLPADLLFIAGAEVSNGAADGTVVGTAESVYSGATFSIVGGRTDLFYMDGADLKVTNSAEWGGIGTTNYVTLQASYGALTGGLVVETVVISGAATGTVFMFR